VTKPRIGLPPGVAATSRKKAVAAYLLALRAEPENRDAWAGLERLLLRKPDPSRIAAVRAQLHAWGVPARRLDGFHRAASKRTGLKALRFISAVRERPDDAAVRASIGRSLARATLEAPEAVHDTEDALVRLPLPTHIRIETASACNLRCQHCPTGVAYKSTDRRVMSPETFDRVLGQIKRLPTLHTAIMYLGGEPLLNKHHATMCRRVKAETQIVLVKFVTNAMMLTEQWCDEIAAANVDAISVSIDGRSPEENDRIRVGASYERVRDNLRMLQARMTRAGCATRIEIANTIFRRPDDPAEAVTPEFLRRDFPETVVASVYAMVWPGMRAEDTALDDLVVHREKPRRFCDHPFYDIGVRANGDIVLCCYDISGRHVTGNVMTDDLLTLFQSEPYVEIRRAMLRGDATRVPEVCRRCLNFTGERYVQNPVRL
jgi:sulfatase maturation enzyme AslB (radical SAM superfamily)